MTEQILQFRIELIHIKPPVWRRILVPAGYTFWDLHVAIQDAMGWSDYHLHLFRLSRSGRGPALEIGIPDDEEFADAPGTIAGWQVPVLDHLSRPGARADYEYDFGDSWLHRVKLEKILPREPRERYPQCLDGARACPPEDCGGTGGYQHLLEVLADPSDEEYEETREWVGECFDPERFDPLEVRFDDPQERWRLAFDEEE